LILCTLFVLSILLYFPPYSYIHLFNYSIIHSNHHFISLTRNYFICFSHFFIDLLFSPYFCIKSYELNRLDPLISNLGSRGVIEDKLSYDIIFICVIWILFSLLLRTYLDELKLVITNTTTKTLGEQRCREFIISIYLHFNIYYRIFKCSLRNGGESHRIENWERSHDLRMGERHTDFLALPPLSKLHF
jgi:hypothetical protein